jgi:hypothetical protein
MQVRCGDRVQYRRSDGMVQDTGVVLMEGTWLGEARAVVDFDGYGRQTVPMRKLETLPCSQSSADV